MWEPGSPIGVVEFYELIAEDARDLIRVGLAEKWGLKPMDAIHLATARRMNANRFHTYDGDLTKYGDVIGIPVEEPIADAPMLALGAATPTPPPSEPPVG